MSSGRRVFVIGVGMTKFEKPGAKDWDYPDMGKEATLKALGDAGVPFSAVEQACIGHVYGDSTSGQRILYTVGMNGIPVYNVNNNCATGSSALFLAKQLVAGGTSECVLALGFEKMQKGSLSSAYNDRTNPLDRHFSVMSETFGVAPKTPFAPQMFGNAGREHMQKYGTTLKHFAKIAEKNHRHSVNNPYAQFRDEYTLEQILASPTVHEPLTKLQCCPTSDGAGAAVLCSESFVYKYGLQSRAIEIVGMSMATDLSSTFDESSCIKMVGFDMTKKAVEEVCRQAGRTVKDVQVVELHANELVTYEALGLCPVGGAGKFIDDGDNTYGGRYVVNPSGGLLSKGHPLGATGLAQCAELVWQLRGAAEKRQVKNVTACLQHNLGLGGAVVVAMYARPDFGKNGAPTQVITAKSRSESIGTASKVEPVAQAPPAASAQSAASSSVSRPSGFLSEAVFATISKQAETARADATFRFDITRGSDKRSWTLDLRKGANAVQDADETTKADCIIGIKDEDFVALIAGKLNPQAAFMKGQLKLRGNMMLAQKLQLLQPKKSKL